MEKKKVVLLSIKSIDHWLSELFLSFLKLCPRGLETRKIYILYENCILFIKQKIVILYIVKNYDFYFVEVAGIEPAS